MENVKIFTKSDIIRQLEEMNAPQDKIVIVHSSLKAVGKVEGGAEALLDILIEYFTQKGGLLCIPTHTWHNIGKEITMDMASGDNSLGALSTIALRKQSGVRSENPIHSLKIFGDKKKAMDFIKDEPFIKTSTAPNGCHGKLFTESGYVLRLGVAQNRNTYLHAVAEILELPNRMAKSPVKTCTKKENGELVYREILLYHTDYIGDISLRFTKYDTAFRYHNCITDGFIGNAPTQLCDARKIKDTVELIYNNSCGVDPLSDEMPIPQKWYCNK